MARAVESIDLLQEYINIIDKNSNHHANSVNKVIYTLIGFIVRYKDSNSILKVLEKDGEIKNVLWVKINGFNYVFSFNHETDKIDMRENNIRGKTIFDFDNNTSFDYIKNSFESLKTKTENI